MATNFYLVRPDNHDVRLHVGKAMGGWQFTFNGRYFSSLLHVMDECCRPGVLIQDEYGNTLHPADFKALVDASAGGHKWRDALQDLPIRIPAFTSFGFDFIDGQFC